MKRAILLLIAGLGAAWVVLWLVEVLRYGPERKIVHWSFAEPGYPELRFDERLGFVAREGWPAQPRFSESLEDTPLLILEQGLLGLKTSTVRQRASELSRRLHRVRSRPVQLELLRLPFANSVQTALWLEPPPNAIVVLTLSARDLVWNARELVGGHPLPRLARREEEIVPGGLTRREPAPPRGLDGILAGIPTLRLLGSVELLPGASGVFPLDLWPFKRGGAGDEARRYEPTRLALELLRARLDRVGSRLMILYLPCALEVGRSSLGSCHAELGLDSRDLESARPARRIKDLAKTLGIVLANPRTRLGRASQRGKPLFRGARTLGSELSGRGRKLVWTELVTALKPWIKKGT